MITHKSLMHARATTILPEDLCNTLQPTGLWFAQTKVDGYRAFSKGGRLFGRNGIELTDKFPEITPPKNWVLDGEIAVVDSDGRADYEATASRAQGGHRGGDEAVFHVFDALEARDSDIRQQSFRQRFSQIIYACESEPWQSRGMVLLNPYSDLRSVWDRVMWDDGEGIVLKNRQAPYVAGRSQEVIKLKAIIESSVVVVGLTPGKGSRADTFGSLQCAQIGEDGVVMVGAVGSGFTDYDLREITALLNKGHLIVIDVAHLGTSTAGLLRQPRFLRVRTDIDPMECFTDQGGSL